ncbi:MAG: hypothetical protein K2N16_09690 [Muribaculaceae bacterium]|nr:hypothetical protein [Muribaculaceae bacterium]
MKTIQTIALASALACLAACGSSKLASTPQLTQMQATAIGTNPVAAMPKAVIYKTNGDYANHVPVTLNDDRTAILSYPGPKDVSADLSTPLPLANGWMLDRRGGISVNTAFLKYTYAQYAAIKGVPTAEALMKEILPDARVTEVKVLPMTLSQALKDPQSLIPYAQ